ncbi:MAG: YbaB/EbfC family nucleoid-associated protein [Clostridiales bacterium]|nr:YbaB/EbfC family nucleoid-associated protein [Clostridiales bacterium]
MARNQFPGFGGGANMQQLMRQAQKMQANMEKMQEELDAKTYEATAGGGMVKCVVSGKRELLSLEIKPEAVDPDDVEMLQDMVMAAVNEALRANEKAREEATGSMVPGGMGGLF